MLDYAWFVIVPQMLDGLAIGLALVLVALGLTLIFGLLHVINVAQGELYMMGAYVGLTVFAATGSFWAALAFAPLAVALLGILVERVAIRPLDGRRERVIMTILSTFGLSLVFTDLASVIWGVQTHGLDAPITGVSEIAGLYYSNYRLFLIALCGALTVLVWWVVHRTTVGAVLRAAAQDGDMVAALGVPAAAVRTAVIVVSAMLAGIAGVLLAPVYAIFPSMGHDFILLAFAVVIIGGLGSVAGAVVAGLLLSQLQALGSLVVSPVWAETLVFVAMIAVLLVRPNGLFRPVGA